MTHLQFERRFDRIVSIEMFEQMKNYERLMSNLADCLKAGGKLLVHIFSHREFAYEYDIANPNDWMAHTALKRRPCGWSIANATNGTTAFGKRYRGFRKNTLFRSGLSTVAFALSSSP